MRVINVLVIIFISGVLGFLSLSFFFGTQRQHITLMHEIPSPVLRLYTAFPIVGIVLIALLTFVNWTLNKGPLHENPVKLKKLFLIGLLSVSLSSQIGSILFIIFN